MIRTEIKSFNTNLHGNLATTPSIEDGGLKRSGPETSSMTPVQKPFVRV